MIPLQNRVQTTTTTTTTQAFEKIDNLGIPKTMYSNQGSEI
jgi:hypothetical protein